MQPQNTRSKVIAANWKMNKNRMEAADFVSALHKQLQQNGKDAVLPEVVLFPAYLSLQTVKDLRDQLEAAFYVGAQNMDSHEKGAYTGEVSPGMLLDLGLTHVIIGHSERRQYFNETDATVNAKLHGALKHNLIPILCVGESLQEREADQTDAVISRQVAKAIEGIDPKSYSGLIFAYEPVWAIGTGKTCAADEANRVCGMIRRQLSQSGPAERIRILYGGSMTPENSAELLSKAEIDGGLVGGASLDPASFSQIILSAVSQASIAV